jgi:hypothetical protein
MPLALADDSGAMHTVWVRDKSSVTRVRIVTLSYGAVYNPCRAYPIVVKWVSGGLDFDDIRTLYVCGMCDGCSGCGACLLSLSLGLCVVLDGVHVLEGGGKGLW